MSKKMMKRSLALGALMAFVITGSAMAADKTVGVSNNTTHKKNDAAHQWVENNILMDLDSPVYNLTNNGIHITGAQPGEAINGNGEANLTTVDLNITVKNTNDPTNPGNGLYTVYGGKLNLTVSNEMVLDVDGHGINAGAYAGDKITINEVGNNSSVIKITAGENGIYTHKNGKLDADGNIINAEIYAKDVTVDATKYALGDAYKGYAVIAAAEKSEILIDASGNVKLKGINGAVKAMNGSTVDINAGGDVSFTSGHNQTTVLASGVNSAINITGNGANKITFTGDGNLWSGGPVAFSARDGGVATLENFDKVIFGGNYSLAGLYAFGGGTVEVNDVGTLTQAEDAYVDMSVYAYGGSVVINADNIDLDNLGADNSDSSWTNGIFVQSSGSNDGYVYANANEIKIKSDSCGISANKMNNGSGTANIEVYGNNIDVFVSDTGTAVGTNNSYQNNVYKNDTNVLVDAKGNLNIVGGIAVIAEHGLEDNRAKVVLNATDMNIETNASENAYAIKATDYGEVVIKASNKANIKGVMSIDGTSKLDLSNVKDLVLMGLEAGNADAAIKVADGGVLNVNTSGTLAIDQAEVGTYKVVDGVGKNVMWANENLAYDRTALFAEGTVADNIYSVTYTTADQMTDEQKETAGKEYIAATGGEELAVPDLVGSAAGAGSIMENTAPGAKEFLAAVSSNPNMLKETKAAVINSAAQLAEAGGNAGTAASVANNVSSVTTGRMSFNGDNKGGHGVGLFEEGSGAAVWAQYMHGKDDATDMPMDGGATSYESEYDGIVVGVDFKKVGKFQSGIAFNYGEGDSTGFTSAAKTQSDYDFWGIGYYGNIRNEDTNFIFDVNYAKSDSDVTQNNAGASAAIEASPETTTWSAGVKVEKLYQNNNVQIVPYTGLRYMSIDTKEYQSNVGGDTLFNYAPERQDIWLLPLGVTIKQEVVNDNGWVVTPKVDLSYIWAFGDTDSNMSVSIPGIAASNDTLGFTVMDDGSFLGLVGVEAKLDDWTFGVSYSYQKGDYAESKKWFVDAKYSF